MPLTREFKETIQVRIERDQVFREELLKEGVESLLAGEVETGMPVFSPPECGSYKRETSGPVSAPLDQEDDSGQMTPRRPPLPEKRGSINSG